MHYAENETNGANYTWCVATAGTCSSATTNNAVASSSICPKGWKLPTKIEYDNLLSKAGITDNAAGSTKISGTPYIFSYAGYINDDYISRDELSNVGAIGKYWSSTANGSNSAYGLFIESDYHVSTTNANGYRYAGLSVRCIAL